MTGPKKRIDTTHQGRGDRTAVEHVSDPYRAREKWPEPTVCPICALIYHRGRWQTGEPPEDSQQHLCPACQRVRDRVPAAQLHLSGDFYKKHRKEIMRLVYNTEEKQRNEHPLERIIDIVDENGETHITFTDHHLAHSIGKALNKAYEGRLDSGYTDNQTFMRVSWSR